MGIEVVVKQCLHQTIKENNRKLIKLHLHLQGLTTL